MSARLRELVFFGWSNEGLPVVSDGLRKRQKVWGEAKRKLACAKRNLECARG